MTQTYYLELGHPMTPPGQVDQLLRSIAESAGMIESVSASGDVYTLHSQLIVTPMLPYKGTDQFLRPFGIERAGQAELILSWTPEEVPQQRDLLTLVMALLSQIPDDAAVHSEYREIWLVRQAGQLWLSDRDELWEPELLALVPPPYQRAPLPFTNPN